RKAAARVLIAAHHAFDALRVRRTAAATGVVIYVSLFERQACVWADRGVSAKVQESEWQEACAALTRGLQQGRPRAGFVEAIARCGAVLGKHCPSRPGDKNELANGLRILD